MRPRMLSHLEWKVQSDAAKMLSHLKLEVQSDAPENAVAFEVGVPSQVKQICRAMRPKMRPHLELSQENRRFHGICRFLFITQSNLHKSRDLIRPIILTLISAETLDFKVYKRRMGAEEKGDTHRGRKGRKDSFAKFQFFSLQLLFFIFVSVFSLVFANPSVSLISIRSSHLTRDCLLKKKSNQEEEIGIRVFTFWCFLFSAFNIFFQFCIFVIFQQ